jgi:hypothetical protein
MADAGEPYGADSAILPPPRGLLGVQPIPPEEGGGLLVICDCATSTQWVIEGIEHLTGPVELPFTCEGCMSVTWFMIGPPAEAARG